MRPAVLLAAWAVCACLQAVNGLVRISELYMPAGQQLALLPGAAMVGVVESALPGVATPEGCAEMCREALPACTFFAFCNAQSGGCSTQSYGELERGECLLLNRNCSLPADREAAPGIVSGFPIHNYPGPIVEAFPTFLTQAILGGDFECPMSEVPGMCAFSNTLSALFNCYKLSSTCVAVTVFANGTNGCSDKPLAVLKTEVPTNANSFVSADTYTVALTEAQKALRTVFMYADSAQLDLPNEAEILATGADNPNSLEYKGCQFGERFLYRGEVVGLESGVPSPQDCCRRCTEANLKAGRRNCTVWNYCGQPGGCVWTSPQDADERVALDRGQCELRFQPLSSSITSLPPSLLAAGPDVLFFAGAPLTLWAPEVPGYTRLPGETIALSGAFACEGSLRPETGECVLPGTLDDAAAYCSRTEQCLAFSYRPAPHNDTASATLNSNVTVPMVSSFKGKSKDPPWVVFPTAVMYAKAGANSSASGSTTSDGSSSSSSSSSSLSGGAIAGIAVGAAAAAAALAAAAWLLLARRQRAAQLPPTKGGEEAAVGNGKLDGAGSWGSASGQRSAASVPCYTPGSMPLDRASSGSRRLSLGAPSTTEGAIPELVQHAAAHEASMLTNRTMSPQPSGEWGDSLMLPPHLRPWVVDAGEVVHLRRPDGSLWQIGSGASSKVYRVEYRGEVLAAKEVELGESQALRETFVTEARMLHKLRHPNVINFAGVTFHGSKGVVLMELCEGRDLHSALQLRVAGTKERLFGWQRRGKRVALDIAKAINFLHQNNVVHMDIKSPNILLTAAGAAKLADCGFSKTKHDSFLSSVSLVGTFAWAAPELLLGTERPTASVDLYSFGVVLYELITGERPQRGQLRMPRDDECPAEVRALMLACLSEKPSARPTALQVLQALRASVEGGAPPPGSHAAAPNGSAGGADGCAADVGNPPSGSPLRAARAMSIQVQPSLPSPFAELPQPGA